jgi:hypothetical protein
MNRLCTALIVTSLFASALPALGQTQRISPHETISTVVDGNRVTIVYGRPYSKDPKGTEIRKIWGGLVPYGKVWRTGSDEATLMITQKPLMMNGTLVPAGAYTLFSLPAADGSAKLIISKQLGQWGLQYDEKQDFARIDMTKSTLPTQVDQFTMAIDKNATGGGGVIKLMWETTQYSMPFTVQK